MKNTKKVLLTFGAIVLGMTVTSSVSAVVAVQEGQLGTRVQTATQNAGVSTTLRNAVQTAVAGAIARCPTIESRIQVKVGNFDNNKIRHMEAYANMKERLAKIDARLAEKGLDTSKLKSELVVPDEKIKKFATDYSTYITKLKESQASVCGQSEGKFLAKIKEAKAGMKVVHQDALDIRAYYVNTIKPELQDLKKQLNDLRTTSSPATNLDLSSEGQVDSSVDTSEEAESSAGITQ